MMVPTRGAPVLALTVKDAGWLFRSNPELLGMVIHGANETTNGAQSEPFGVTSMLPAPPAGVKLAEVLPSA
jgi:hypothetical protein